MVPGAARARVHGGASVQRKQRAGPPCSLPLCKKQRSARATVLRSRSAPLRRRLANAHRAVHCRGRALPPRRGCCRHQLSRGHQAWWLCKPRTAPMAGPPVGDRSLARLKKPPDRLEALSTGMEAFSRGARVSAVQLLGRPLRDAAAASLDKILEVRGPAQCKAGFGQGCVPARRR